MTFAPIDETAHGEQLRGVLGDFCRRAGLIAPAEKDLVARLIHAGRGRFGRCIESMIQAIKEALRKGDRHLDMHHFAEVFMLTEGCTPDRNVFLHPAWRQINVDAPPSGAARRWAASPQMTPSGNGRPRRPPQSSRAPRSAAATLSNPMAATSAQKAPAYMTPQFTIEPRFDLVEGDPTSA